VPVNGCVRSLVARDSRLRIFNSRAYPSPATLARKAWIAQCFLARRIFFPRCSGPRTDRLTPPPPSPDVEQRASHFFPSKNHSSECSCALFLPGTIPTRLQLGHARLLVAASRSLAQAVDPVRSTSVKVRSSRFQGKQPHFRGACSPAFPVGTQLRAASLRAPPYSPFG
jgi:hypothetical protein